MTEQGINEFVGNHYEALVDAFAAHDRETFAAAVAAASRRTRSAPSRRPVRRADPMLICIDAGHYIGTPGKRCLKSIDPGETRSGP